MIRLFEAFSGYGSQALALNRYNVQYKSVGIAEIDKYAVKAHEELHGPVKNYGDVSLLEVKELPDMDLFTYSFPCQDISNAGKQRGLEKGSGTRSSLLWECERIIKGKRPMFLMMENVKNLVGKKNKPHFDEWLQVLESLGYNNYWKVINAKWCGVPQNRERVFCVSIRKDIDNGMFNFYEDFDNGIRLKDILETEVDGKYYLSDEMTKGLIERITSDGKYKGYINQNTQASKVMDVEKEMQTICAGTHGYANGYVKVKEATKKGYKEANPGDNINLEHPNSTTRRGRVGVGVANCLTTSCNQAVVEPNVLTPKRTEYGKSIRKQYEKGEIKESRHNMTELKPRTDGISNTITTVQKDNWLHDSYRIRKLTPYECLILMGLTHEEAMILVNSGISNSQLYKMGGNSIVINCMRFLKKLEAIYILNENKPDRQLTLF